MIIHRNSEVQSNNIGDGTQIWQYVIILEGASIGKNCNINCHTFIENDVVIGDNVTIKSGVYLWDGLRIKDDVFIGPGVVFTNDLFPRSKKRVVFVNTCVEKGVSIGANATIKAGVTLGSYCLIGAGAVVTKDVHSHALCYGNPAKQHGWVDELGEKLILDECGVWKNSKNQLYRESDTGLIKINSI